MFKWLLYMFSPNQGMIDAAKIHAAQVQASNRQANLTENALRRLEEWEAAVSGLCFAGVISTGDAVQEVEHIARIRRELSFRVNDAEWNAARAFEEAQRDMAAHIGTSREEALQWQEPRWKPGVEHQQPHPVKENPDGTLYYKGWVYRKIGDHGPKTPREQRRRRWHKGQNGV